MPRAILVGPDLSVNEELLAAVRQTPVFELVEILSSYPDPVRFSRSIQLYRPDVVLLSTEVLATFESTAQSLSSCVPGLLIIGFGRPLDVPSLTCLMHLGIREYLATPFTPADLQRVARSVGSLLQQHPPPVVGRGDLYSFLPAKGGVGSSTVAASVSSFLSDRLHTRTLLLDADLAAGTLRFQLNLTNSTSLLDALRRGPELDERLWLDLIGHEGKLEVLHAGNSDYYPEILELELHPVLTLARAQYQVICVDLGLNLCAFTTELLNQSRQIFLVTTPELAAVHLAAQRMERLNELGLGDRVTVLVNRHSAGHHPLRLDAITELLGHPPARSLPDDPAGVEQALLAGESLPIDSPLGASLFDLARSLTPAEAGPHEPPGFTHRFLEFLHLPLPPDSNLAMRD